MAAIIQINSGAPGASNDNLPLNTVVTLTSVDVALHSYTWAIVSQPEGPNDNIVGSGQTVTFTPKKEGSYLVKLTVDFGYPSEDSQQLIAAVRELETGDRIPAIGETTENSVNDGWANPVDAVLQRVTRYTDAGVQTGVAGEALAVGDVVYAADVYTLAPSLPGERVVASWSKAHADVLAEVQGVFGVVSGSVLGGSIVTGNVITVQTTGLYQGVPFGSAPSVGDPVFISDAAQLSLTEGTIKRQVGTVCAVGGSTYDVMVGPAPAEIAPENLYVKTYYVSTDGSDVVGDGSMHNPFATPQKAHDVALADYPTEWVSVEIGPGSYVGPLTVEKWNIVFHGSGSRPETQATKILGVVTVTPDAATQKFNDVVGLDRLFIEPPSIGSDPALYVTGTGAFSVVVTDCYLTTNSASATSTVFVDASNALRPRVTLNDCIVTVQAAGPDLVYLDRGDVRVSNLQALFGSSVPSGSAGKGFVVANDASLFADRLLLDMQTLGPGIEVTGSYAGTKLTLSSSAITLSFATSSHGVSLTNGSTLQLAGFIWNTVFGVANLASKAINGSGSLGSNLVVNGQLSYIYNTSSAIGATVTMLAMTGDIAGGDLSGNLPSPTVAKLQGRAVSSTAPTSGQVLGWNGTNWIGRSTIIGAAGVLGDAVTITGGQGTSTIGGDVTITGGQSLGGTGAAASLTGGQGSTTGGSASLTGGVGTTTGGAATLTGGAAPTGGLATVTGGASSGAAAGGTAAMVGGAGTSGNGGVAAVLGGDSSGGGNGGSAALDGGIGATNGSVVVGTVRAEQVSLGRTGKNVTTSGLNVEAAVTYAPVAGTTIPVTSPTIILNAAAPVTMTATPTIQTSGVATGTRLTIIGGTNAVTFQRVSALAGSALRLANPTQTLDLYDVMTIIFDGTYWREVSVSLNS